MRALGVRRLARAVPRDYVEALIGYWLTIGTTRLWTLAAVIAPAPERLFAAPTDLSGRRQSQDALRQVTSRDALRTGYRTTGRDGDWWAAANVSWWPRRAAHLLFATRCPLRRLGPKHACRGQLLLGGRVGLLESVGASSTDLSVAADLSPDVAAVPAPGVCQAGTRALRSSRCARRCPATMALCSSDTECPAAVTITLRPPLAAARASEDSGGG